MKTYSAEQDDHSEEEVHQQGPAELIVHLRQMVNDPAFSDVVFVCNDEKRVHAQRMLLAGRSEVLKSLLLNGMAETGLSEIELHEISSRSFLSVLEFLYTGTLLDYRPQSWTVACEMLLASRFFILPTMETVIRTFRHKQILNVARDLTKAAALLTEAVGYGLCDEKDDFLADLVIILSPEWSVPKVDYLQTLSEDAFHYLLANSKGNCEDDSTLSFKEYVRFLIVIIWSIYKSGIGSQEAKNLLDAFLAALKRAVSLCKDSDNRGEGPEDAPSLLNDSTLCQLRGAPKDSLMRLLLHLTVRGFISIAFKGGGTIKFNSFSISCPSKAHCCLIQG